jgi:hypothetical protein
MSGKWICIRWDDDTLFVHNLDRVGRIVFRKTPEPEVIMEDNYEESFGMAYLFLARIVDVYPLTDDPIALWVVEKIRSLIPPAKEFAESHR